MRFTNVTKRVLSLAVAAAVVASAVTVPVAPKKAEAAKSYKAYLCFMSLNYGGVADNHDASNFKLGVYNGNTKTKIKGVKTTTASFKKGKVSFTVSATGKNLKKFASDKGWNTIYVDTTLPGTDKSKLKVTSVTLKIDGKTVKTIKNPALTPDPGKTSGNTQIMVLNTWNQYAEKKYSADKLKKMPKKSISVTVTGKLKK